MVGKEEKKKQMEKEKENSSLDQPDSSDKKSNKFVWYYIFGLVCVVACIGMGCYYIYNKLKK